MIRQFNRLNEDDSLPPDERFARARSGCSAVRLCALVICCVLSVGVLGCANSGRLLSSVPKKDLTQGEPLTVRSNSDGERSGTMAPFVAPPRDHSAEEPVLPGAGGHSLTTVAAPPNDLQPRTEKEALELVQSRFDRLMQEGNLIPRSPSPGVRPNATRAGGASEANSIADEFMRWQQQRDAEAVRNAVIAESVKVDAQPSRSVQVQTTNEAPRSPFVTAADTASTSDDVGPNIDRVAPSSMEGPAGIPAQTVSQTSPPDAAFPLLENRITDAAGSLENAVTGVTDAVLEQADVLLTPGDIQDPVLPPENPGMSTPPEAMLSEEDASVLDRLRGLLPPENASERLRRQIRKIPVPWTRRDDETVPAPAQPATAGVSMQPTEVPIDAAGPVSSQLLLDQLIEQTRAEIRDWPRSADGKPLNERLWLQRQMDLRLLLLVAENYSDAIAAPESVPVEHQEFLQNLMLAMAQYRDVESVPDDSLRSARTSSQLRAATESLRSLSPLTITRLEFCRRIHSYGNLETFPTYEFRAGQPLLLYAEIDSFHPELMNDGSHQTVMNGEIRIVRFGDNEPIDTIALPQIEDTTQSTRRDFYHSYELTLPAHLKAGRYSVYVRLIEPSTRRTASASVDFIIR